MTADPPRARAAARRRCQAIYGALYEVYGDLRCPLRFDTPFQLLVVAILSAQCADARVNQITPALFERLKTPADFASVSQRELEELIKTAGLFRNKAKNIITTAKIIQSAYHGELPSDMERLTALPGVGRKTANVIQAHAFSLPGFPVDTHVKRVSKRTGLTDTDDPVKVERMVRSLMPPEPLPNFSLLLIQHGRNRCRSRKPDCRHCEIQSLCDTGRRAAAKP